MEIKITKSTLTPANSVEDDERRLVVEDVDCDAVV